MNAIYGRNEERYRIEREIQWLDIVHCLCLLLLPTAGIDLSRNRAA